MRLRRLGVGMFAGMLMLSSVSVPAVSGLAEKRLETTGAEGIMRAAEVSVLTNDTDSDRPTGAVDSEKSTDVLDFDAHAEAPNSDAPVDGANTEAPSDGTNTDVPADGANTEAPSDGTNTDVPADETSTEAPSDGTSTDVPSATPAPDAPADGTNTEDPSATPDPDVPADGTNTEDPSASPNPDVPADGTNTEDPSASPDPNAPSETEKPAVEVAIRDLMADKTVYAPGEEVIWSFTCDGAENISYVILNSQGVEMKSGELTAAETIRFQTETCDAYTLTVTATAGEDAIVSDSKSSTIYVSDNGEATVSLETDMRYAVANESEIVFQAKVQGGIAPYSVAVQIAVEGGVVYEDSHDNHETGDMRIAYMPVGYGVHTVSIEVTDAAGRKSTASAELPVAIREPETETDWKNSVSGAPLTGDPRSDLVAVARTQIGYAESARDFVIDEDGNVHGYTRYGAWCGHPYDDWSAMFASFCLNYANVSTSVFPRSTNCGDWQSALSGNDMYRAKESYEPKPGDLIFLNLNGGSAPDHVGIVESVSGGTVSAIEGDLGNEVVRSSYSITDSRIAGYGRLLADEEKNQEITLIASWEGETLGVGDVVTLTAKNSGDAKLLWQCLKAEDGEWETAPNQDGCASYTFEVTRENCGWAWRATYDNAEETEVVEG